MFQKVQEVILWPVAPAHKFLDLSPGQGDQMMCPINYQKLVPFDKLPGPIASLVFNISTRVALCAGIWELDSLIVKDLIDSKDPKHTLFCRKLAFVTIYPLFRDNISIL